MSPYSKQVLFKELDAKIIRQVKTNPRQNPLLDISYQPREVLADVISDPNTIAVIDYGDHSLATAKNLILVGTPAIAGNEMIEVWRSSSPPEYGSLGSIHYRRTSELLFGQIRIPSAHGDLEATTRTIYQKIRQLQQESSYTHLIRIWNYMPWINREDNQMERYQSFCVGRHQAIDTSSGFEEHLPAATAIGTHDDNMLVYFVAAREDGIQIENPRQVSAFEYPSQYAPKSPAFSRAIVKQWGQQKHLYISGTASILGHETQHREMLVEQLDECLNNMDILIQEADHRSTLGINNVSDLTGIKLYLRNVEDLQPVLSRLRKRIGDRSHVMVLHADICRRDLLLEIEGFYVGKEV
jgi:chorismate lyase/3-hydroxybenzoate synthase